VHFGLELKRFTLGCQGSLLIGSETI
jgi:hypothetical protein